MDPQIAKWQSQAAEALKLHPDKEDEIYARLQKAYDKRAMEWYSSAQDAINNKGADAAKVSDRFNRILSDNGFSTPEPVVLTQGRADVFSNVEAGVESAYNPEAQLKLEQEKAAAAKAAAREEMGFGERLSTDLQGVADNIAGQGLRGLSGIVGSAEPLLRAAPGYNPGMSDDLFSAVDTMRKKGDEILGQTPLAADATAYAGIVPQVMGSFAGDSFNEGVRILEEGGTLDEAQRRALDQGAINSVGMAAGLLGKQGRGIKDYLTRTAAQVPANVALGAIDRTGRGEENTGLTVAEDAAMGAFGAIFREPSLDRIKTKPIVEKTGIPAIDAGAEFAAAGQEAAKVGTAKIDFSKFPKEQMDMFSPNGEAQLSVDMFSGETTPASLMEQRRLRQEQALRGEDAQRTDAETAQLEKDYILDMQDKLGAEARIAQTEPPVQADLANFGITEVDRSPTANVLREEPPIPGVEGNAVGYTETGPNTAMRDAMRAAGERRTTGLQNQDMFSGPYKEGELGADSGPTVFEPSKNKTIEQAAPEQAGLDFGPEQKDLFGNSQEAGAPRVEEAAPVVAKPVTAQDIKDRLAQAERPLFAAADGSSTPAPRAIQDRLAAGTLTAREVLEHTSNAKHPTPEATTEANNLSRYLTALSDRIGGRDTTLAILDDTNPVHQEVLTRHASKLGNGYDAFYDAGTNRIYIQRGKDSSSTLLHEVAHGITSKMLMMGENGDLKGQAQAAYTNLVNTFKDVLLPELTKRVEALPIEAQRKLRKYGLTDIHEFYSEFFSNNEFRKSLKEMKIDDTLRKALDAKQNGLLTKAKNIYDLVVGTLANMMGRAGVRTKADLGMADNMASAYEVMFANMDKLHNKIENSDAALLRDVNSRNTNQKIDTSFLGEQVEQRAHLKTDTTDTPTPQKPRNKWVAAAKGLLSGTGVDRKVTTTKENISGEKKAAKTQQVVDINVAEKAVSALSKPARAEVNRLLTEAVKDITTLTAKKNLDRVEEISPALGKLMKRALNDKYTNSKEYVQALLDSQAHRETPSSIITNFAAKALDNLNSYIYRSYAGPKETKARYNNAVKAKKKLANGKTLTEREQFDVDSYDALVDHLNQRVFGDAESLSALSTEELTSLYKSRVGEDKAVNLKGVDSKAARTIMLNTIADQNAKIPNMGQAVDNLIKEISNGMEHKSKAVSSYLGAVYGKDTLKSRDFVPEAIRDWLGEIQDPITNIINTVHNQQVQLAEIKALNELRTDGLKSGLFQETPGGTSSTVQLEGQRWGALEGLHTTVDVKNALDVALELGTAAEDLLERLTRKSVDKNTLGGLLATGAVPLVRTLRAAKTATTVGNPGAWARNLGGSAWQLVSNGNINPKDMITYGTRGGKAIGDLIGISNKTNISEDAMTLVRNDLVEGTQTHDTYNPKNRAKMDKLVEMMQDDPAKARTWLDGIKKDLQTDAATVDFLKEAYGAMDLWTKAANFFYELDKRKAFNERNGIKMSDKALEKQVADRIKDTNISQSRSPLLLRLSETGGITQFAAYYYETLRTSLKNVKYGIEDIKEGQRLKDSEWTAHGVKRLAGVATAVAGANATYIALAKGIGYATGATVAMTGEALSEYMDDDGFQKPDSTLLYKDGEDTYGFDVGMISPYDPTWQVVKELVASVGDPKNADKHLGKAVGNIGDLMSQNSALKGMVKAYQGKAPSISYSSPETYNAIQETATELNISPKVVDSMLDIMEPNTPKVLKEIARASSTKGNMTTKAIVGSGIGAYKIDPMGDLEKYNYHKFDRETNDKKKAYKELMSAPWNVKPAKLEAAFEDAIKASIKPYEQLKRNYEAAIEQGASPDDVFLALKKNKAPSSMIDMLETGEVYPIDFVKQDFNKTMKSEIDAAKTEEDKDKIEARWEERLDVYDRMLDKYEGMTLEQLLRESTDE